MVVERSPTPPLLELHVSQFLLSDLSQLLKDRTAGLNIEQLRATSLGTNWRHRKKWNRDILVRELLRNVKEFIEEVGESDGDIVAVSTPAHPSFNFYSRFLYGVSTS